ncbi:tripartite tricarboxylate transporter TctB family protein [Falsirhodobacter algicola]|uniref:DUF1468 domain-containing protein n=1 Tax=Falsirhodobacter algicola TaxID=2692330 RepID=A0A8J8MU20_9RHOB|nr:tripartite tricarboxylate transporter TctB family protein [Falsirhodobacter algicola]QUS36736.1 hypothetical protein GR316_10970 [Falsirhodobacter algicola]
MDDPNTGALQLARAAFFAGIAIVGLAMLEHGRASYAGTIMRGDPGPFFLGRLCLIAIGLYGVGLGIVALTGRRGGRGKSAPASRSGLMLAGAMVLTLMVLPGLMQGVGTTWAVAIFAMPWLGVLLARSGVPHRRAAMGAVLFALLIAVTVRTVFIHALNIPLPS